MDDELTLDNQAWFRCIQFDGLKQLSQQSDITLKLTALFYPLSKIVEVMLTIGLLVMAASPFIRPDFIPAISLAVANIILVPSHLALRYWLIKQKYQIKAPLRCHLSKDRISFPANSLIDEPVGQLDIRKQDIRNIEVYYWSQTRDSVSTNSVTQLHIHHHSGKITKLVDIYYPLRNMLYLMIHFNYPTTFIKKRWSTKHMLRIVLLAFPVIAHIATSGYFAKELFFFLV